MLIRIRSIPLAPSEYGLRQDGGIIVVQVQVRSTSSMYSVQDRSDKVDEQQLVRA